jgi:hypothetical protein
VRLVIDKDFMSTLTGLKMKELGVGVPLTQKGEARLLSSDGLT